MKIFLGGIIAFLIWSATGLYYYACHIKDYCDPEAGQYVPAEYSNLQYSSRGLPLYNQDQLYLRAPGELKFSPSSSRFYMPEAFKPGLNRMVYMLRENSRARLIILSRYDPDWDEKAAASFALKRGERLKDSLCAAGADCASIEILVQAIDLDEGQTVPLPIFELRMTDSLLQDKPESTPEPVLNPTES